MDNILEMFIMNPEKGFHVREIARKLKKSPTTISKYLKNYEKLGILRSEKKFNHLLFMANLSENFRHKKIMFNLDRIDSSGLVEFLKNKLDYPEAVILFGSWARGKNSGESDLDLLIISPNKKELDLKKFSNKLGEVQLFILSRSEIDKMKKDNPELLNSFVNGLVLEGAWELFE